MASADTAYAKQISTGKYGFQHSKNNLTASKELRATRLETVRRNMLNEGVSPGDIEIGWTDLATAQKAVETYNKSLKIDDWAFDIATARKKRIDEIKEEGRIKFANETDWYIVRKAENGTPIPQTILEYRSAMRTAINSAEGAIYNLTDKQVIYDFQITWPRRPKDAQFI